MMAFDCIPSRCDRKVHFNIHSQQPCSRNLSDSPNTWQCGILYWSYHLDEAFLHFICTSQSLAMVGRWCCKGQTLSIKSNLELCFCLATMLVKIHNNTADQSGGRFQNPNKRRSICARLQTQLILISHLQNYFITF